MVLVLKWRRKIYRVTHTRLTALCPGLHGWAGTRKVIPVWILLKQETVSGSEIRWAVCKSAPCSRQITTPAPRRSVFLQAGCPSCCPTNSVKALTCSCYSNKIPQLYLGKYPYYHRLTNKAYLSAIKVTNICQSSTYKMAAKINWNEITSLSPYVFSCVTYLLLG